MRRLGEPMRKTSVRWAVVGAGKSRWIQRYSGGNTGKGASWVWRMKVAGSWQVTFWACWVSDTWESSRWGPVLKRAVRLEMHSWE